MKTIIFYSWQSDLPNSTNRGFIQQCLEHAAREMSSDQSISVEPVIDRDTAGVPGSPDIATTILNKIDNCDVFACDVSIINPNANWRLTPNPNVLIELGYALKRLGWNYIVMIFNTAFGNVKDLPFDLRMKRVITYSAKEEEKDRTQERKSLQARLSKELKVIFAKIEKPTKENENLREVIIEKKLRNNEFVYMLLDQGLELAEIRTFMMNAKSIEDLFFNVRDLIDSDFSREGLDLSLKNQEDFAERSVNDARRLLGLEPLGWKNNR